MVGLRLRFWLGEVVLMSEVSAMPKAIKSPIPLELRNKQSKPLEEMASTKALIEAPQEGFLW